MTLYKTKNFPEAHNINCLEDLDFIVILEMKFNILQRKNITITYENRAQALQFCYKKFITYSNLYLLCIIWYLYYRKRRTNVLS